MNETPRNRFFRNVYTYHFSAHDSAQTRIECSRPSDEKCDDTSSPPLVCALTGPRVLPTCRRGRSTYELTNALDGMLNDCIENGKGRATTAGERRGPSMIGLLAAAAERPLDMGRAGGGGGGGAGGLAGGGFGGGGGNRLWNGMSCGSGPLRNSSAKYLSSLSGSRWLASRLGLGGWVWA